MLLAGIRDKGRCPCPKCLVPFTEVDRLGTVRDIKQRKALARIDDQIKQDKVTKAREYIYQRNVAVDNVDVETLLKGQSLVPTNVFLLHDQYQIPPLTSYRMCFQSD